MKTFDARGLSCPQPVLVSKKAMESNIRGFSIVVDNDTAKENVKRFMENNGYRVEIKNFGGDYELVANK